MVDVPLFNRVQRSNADIPPRRRTNTPGRGRRGTRSRRIQQLEASTTNNAPGPSTSGIQTRSQMPPSVVNRTGISNLTSRRGHQASSISSEPYLPVWRERLVNPFNSERERFVRNNPEQATVGRAVASNQASPSHIASRTRSRLDRAQMRRLENNTVEDEPPRRRRRIESTSSSSSSD